MSKYIAQRTHYALSLAFANTRHEMLRGGGGGIKSNKVNQQSCILVRFWQRISNPNEVSRE